MTWSSEPSVWGVRGQQQTLDRLSEVIHTHTLRDILCADIKSHTSTQGAIKCCLGWKAFFLVCVWVCVLAHKAQTNGFNPSTSCVCVSKPPCPCCDIIYECHNWGSVNCRFSPLSVAPCVNTEVQGDGADQYAETGAIRWIYSPVTREQRNDACCSLQRAAGRDRGAAGEHLSNMHTSDSPRNFVFLLFWGIKLVWGFFASVTAVGCVLMEAVKEFSFGWVIGPIHRRYFELS